MHKMLERAALVLLALLATCSLPAPVAAQRATTSAAPAGYAPEYAPVVVPAVSPTSGGLTEIAGTVTSSACTATVGACSFATGTASIGVLAPQLGRDVRVVLKGTWVGTVQIGTSTAANACAAGTINPLTIGGSAWGSYTGNANEVVDTPTLAGIVYCATATITSGTLTYSVRQ